MMLYEMLQHIQPRFDLESVSVIIFPQRCYQRVGYLFKHLAPFLSLCILLSDSVSLSADTLCSSQERENLASTCGPRFHTAELFIVNIYTYFSILSKAIRS